MAHKESVSHAALANTLRIDDLSVVFQPIVNLRTRRVFAYEALVRCKTPGLESPPKLFEHAVTNGYSGRLGRLIRQLTVKACRGIPIFTNVHPEELGQRFLVQLDDPIFSHDSDVYIEITESVPFSHYDRCVQVLTELRTRASVHLVIDDLGSGFSNLMRIVELQPKIVKIDMALVRGVDKHPRQLVLVRSIVQMCAAQGAAVVAEGIETAEELAAIIATGCAYGQGYVLGRPAFPPPPVEWPLK